MQEGLNLAREIKYREMIITLLANLGILERYRGNCKQAKKYFEEGLDVAHLIKHRERASALLAYLGTLARDQKDYEQAKEYFRKGLELAQQIGYPKKRITTLLNDLHILETNQSE